VKKSDIVWYNSQTGETQIWFMNDNRIASRATVVDENGNFIPIGLPFSIVGAGDMNGNGKADIVWYNSQTGETQIWFMNDNRIASRATVVDENGNFIPIGLPFSIVGVGEFKPLLQPPIVNPAITLSAVQDQGRFIEVTGIRFTLNQTVKLDYFFQLQSDVNTSTSGTETLTSDGNGSFVFRIRVTLVDISSAQVKATDIASGKTATALLEGM